MHEADFVIDRKFVLGLGNSDVPGANGLSREGGEEGAVRPLQEPNFLIDGKIMMGLGNSDVQVLTANPGKEVKKGLFNLCRFPIF